MIYFAIPGDLNTLTGGYGYDRELIAGLRRLGLGLEILPLADEFPLPSAAALARTAACLAALPDGATLIVDGLGFGAMDAIAQRECRRLRLIALCHHPLALETGLSAAQAAALRQSETRALAAAHAIVVTSAATARLLEREFSVPAAKITLAPPGTRRPTPGATTRAENGGPPVLLTLASLTRRKGHDTLTAALAEICHLPWRARFVGGDALDPAWAARLRHQVEQAGLAGRISFVGEVADPAPELAGADLFVLPSRFEGYGMAFAEALAFGLPVVAARAGAVADLVPEDAGLLVAPDNPAELAAALAQLLTDCTYRQRLREGAHRAARSLPTWEQCAQVVAQLLQPAEFP